MIANDGRASWSPAALQLLQETYSSATPAELSQVLAKPWSAIKCKAHKLGLNRKKICCDEASVVRAYESGRPLAEICSSFGFSTPKLYLILNAHGVARKNVALSDSPEFRADYQVLGMAELETKYSVSRPTLRAKAKELGLLRPKALKHKRTKLTEAQQSGICAAFIAGTSREEIAKSCGVSATTVTNLTRRKELTRPSHLVSCAQTALQLWLQEVSGLPFSPNRVLLGGKEIDLYCPELKLGIGYCGLYWHTEDSPAPRDAKYHAGKFLRCKEQGVRLITIFEDEWQNRQTQVKGFLRSVLKANTRRINARDCSVAVLPKKQAEEFIEQWHIQGANQRGVVYAGLSLDGELLGCMSFGPHPRETGVLVLDRLCFKSGCSVVGGASKLFKLLLRETEPNSIVSWSDNRWSNGEVYPLLGFRKEADLPPDYSYVDFISGGRKSKQSQKKSATGCPAGMTELAFARSKDLHRIWDCGKIRWSWSPFAAGKTCEDT